MNKLYKAVPDGYCGDEDNGQTSAWYVFAAMGFYPVCPATDQYVLGTPLFKKLTVQLENGKSIVLNAPANSADNYYIQAINWNGKAYNKNWISHSELQKGAELNFIMSSKPNKQRGTGKDAYPFSMTE